MDVLREYFEFRIYATYKAMLVASRDELGVDVINAWYYRSDEACKIATELGILAHCEVREIKKRVEQELEEITKRFKQKGAQA